MLHLCDEVVFDYSRLPAAALLTRGGADVKHRLPFNAVPMLEAAR